MEALLREGFGLTEEVKRRGRGEGSDEVENDQGKVALLEGEFLGHVGGKECSVKLGGVLSKKPI